MHCCYQRHLQEPLCQESSYHQEGLQSPSTQTVCPPAPWRCDIYIYNLTIAACWSHLHLQTNRWGNLPVRTGRLWWEQCWDCGYNERWSVSITRLCNQQLYFEQSPNVSQPVQSVMCQTEYTGLHRVHRIRTGALLSR